MGAVPKVYVPVELFAMADAAADALHAEIEAVRQELQAEEAIMEEVCAEVDLAEERQKLRRKLEEVRDKLRRTKASNEFSISFRQEVDEDVNGLHLNTQICHSKQPRVVFRNFSGSGSTDFGEQVAHGEYVWTMTGMRWLKDALWADSHRFAECPEFTVGCSKFQMLYSPDAGQLIGSHHGSLALFYRTHVSVPVYEEISCQYSLYIKAPDGSFVQWGETGHGRYDSEVAHDWREVCFGPDVHWEGHRPTTPAALGIFGLSHEQLLQSEWVQDDTLTVKCVLEVRPRYFDSRLSVSLSAELPGPSIVRDMQALFEKGTNSDVRFMVEGEVIHAHSAVLCQRPAS